MKPNEVFRPMGFGFAENLRANRLDLKDDDEIDIREKHKPTPNAFHVIREPIQTEPDLAENDNYQDKNNNTTKRRLKSGNSRKNSLNLEEALDEKVFISLNGESSLYEQPNDISNSETLI